VGQYFIDHITNNTMSFSLCIDNQLELSCEYQQCLAPRHQLEQTMVQRLLALCEKHHWTFTLSDIVNSVDGLLNGKRAQVKYSSRRGTEKHNYGIHTGKSVDGKRAPYHATDFDVLIVMVGSCIDRVYVIPMETLIEYGIVTTGSQSGITAIHLRNPSAAAYAPRNRYWKHIMPSQPPPQLLPSQTICDKCHRSNHSAL